MNIESRNLRDEASQVYLEQVLVFDEMERLRLARQVLCGIFAVSVAYSPPTRIGTKMKR
ncbi:Uncharacterised protein [Serratia marcescens]|nr:hypothetical protein SM14BL03_21140 [Serratia marcescens]CAI0791578.1 Uncharacterised protein [Serratia marcescens]CAI1555631.1 Uncharacterised protein [Serratia marcescens]CAI1620024.1 Uncharacterised protein [Serratia marcescens]CUY69691.1 Uncharacterised protein [Serratia marcescens]